MRSFVLFSSRQPNRQPIGGPSDSLSTAAEPSTQLGFATLGDPWRISHACPARQIEYARLLAVVTANLARQTGAVKVLLEPGPRKAEGR